MTALPEIDLRVLTTDAAGPRLSQKVRVSRFPMYYPGGYEVYFTQRLAGQEIAPGLLSRLWHMVRWADVVHLTGTYSFPTIPTLLACRILKRPLIWSPRGALKATHEWDGARRLRLKRIWEGMCSMVMPQRCRLHVASEAERTASIARLPLAVTIVIPNGVDIPDLPPARRWVPDGTLRLVFIGRLHPVKGIENLLEALSLLSEEKVVLDVYGSGNFDYSERLRAYARSLGLSKRVKFHGHVDADAKLRAFIEADVCVVPSHTENFGMVVAEALAHGVPVIASCGTPWSLIEQIGCGLWVENIPATLARAIQQTQCMDLATMGQRGRKWMEKEYRWELVAAKMKTAYEELMHAA